jgi:hypothetical protein
VTEDRRTKTEDGTRRAKTRPETTTRQATRTSQETKTRQGPTADVGYKDEGSFAHERKETRPIDRGPEQDEDKTQGSAARYQELEGVTNFDSYQDTKRSSEERIEVSSRDSYIQNALPRAHELTVG